MHNRVSDSDVTRARASSGLAVPEPRDHDTGPPIRVVSGHAIDHYVLKNLFSGSLKHDQTRHFGLHFFGRMNAMNNAIRYAEVIEGTLFTHHVDAVFRRSGRFDVPYFPMVLVE